MANTRFRSFVIGDTLPFDLELSVEGVPENLEGAEIWATLKTNLTDEDAAAAFQVKAVVPNGPDAQAGKYRLTIPSDETRVPAGKYWFDIQRVFPGNPPDVWTIYREQVEAVQDVTRDDA